jgi:hypothetical protein
MTSVGEDCVRTSGGAKKGFFPGGGVVLQKLHPYFHKLYERDRAEEYRVLE